METHLTPTSEMKVDHVVRELRMLNTDELREVNEWLDQQLEAREAKESAEKVARSREHAYNRSIVSEDDGEIPVRIVGEDLLEDLERLNVVEES